MAVKYAEEDCSPRKILLRNGDIPVYAFGIDYILLRNREELGREYKGVKFDHFKFSIKSFHRALVPTTSNSDEKVEKMDDQFLHSFGNAVSLQIVKIQNLEI